MGVIFLMVVRENHLSGIQRDQVMEILRKGCNGECDVRTSSNRGVHERPNDSFTVQDVLHVVKLARSGWGLVLRKLSIGIDRRGERCIDEIEALGERVGVRRLRQRDRSRWPITFNLNPSAGVLIRECGSPSGL